MIKLKRKSITVKLFLILFMMMFLLVGIVGTIIITDTNKVIKKEVYSMNKQVLSEIGNNTSILLANVENMINSIVVDSKLVDILSLSEVNLKKQSEEYINNTNSYIRELLLDNVFRNYKSNMKPEIYIIGENGLSYSTYSKTKYDIDELKKQGLYSKITETSDDIVFVNTYEDEAGVGPYRYIFKMGKAIKDLVTGEIKGVLIIHISEKMLYDRYYETLKNGSNVYIVDSKGMVISSKDKREIGESYNYFYKRVDGDTILKDNQRFMKMSSKINEFGWSIIQEIPLRIMKQPANEIKNRIIIMLAVVVVINIIICYKISAWITKPILDIKDKMIEVENGNLKVVIEGDREDEIGELEESFNSMVKKLDYYIREIKHKEEQKRLAELSFLQAQINPHFLYNTLTGVRFLISMGKADEAEEMTFRFMKLLRSILPSASECITLEEELNNIKNYVELLKMRYPNCFEFSCSIEDEIAQFKVPSFILQPVVENAILYSMEKENNKGIINVVAYKGEDGIRIVVKDNGIGMSKSKVESVFNKGAAINRVGLTNVNERVQLNYGKEYGLKITSEEGKGTKVIFVLPS